jgi:hypothetical protein
MKSQSATQFTKRIGLWTALFTLGASFCAISLCAMSCLAQQQAPAAQQSPKPALPQSTEKPKPETHITPEQAKQLFALVDQLMKFSSDETGLPIKADVKRKLTSRADVESYLRAKFDDDQDAKRLQQGEIVLKKFGLLDHDFQLKPFLLALLKEQIEAYYDSKTKTVYMLDWIEPDEQKSVLAHELTHALQDQHVDLEKWSDQTPDEVSHTYNEDVSHVAKDELDTARDAIAEGQATAVMIDNELKPLGKSLLKDPEVVDFIQQQMVAGDDSPVMARAPLLLSESLIFPYRDGLSFEQALWMDKGRDAAFTGALDHPPTSTWEVMNPRYYEQGRIPPVPIFPNIHPLVDATYKPYDIGQVGQLDLFILTRLFGGDNAARDLVPAWDGGIYWAGQRLSATTPAEQASTKSISLLYLSAWKSAQSAQAFAHLYANSLGRKYSGLHQDTNAAPPANAPSGEIEQVYTTDEGPVVITTRDKLVFVSESFDLPLARQLTELFLDAQGTGETRIASAAPNPSTNTPDLPALSDGLVHFFADCGVMKSAIPAVRLATQ